MEKHFQGLKRRIEIEDKVTDKINPTCISKLVQAVTCSNRGDLNKCSKCDGFGIIYTGPEELDESEELDSDYFDFCNAYESSEGLTPEDVQQLIKLQSIYTESPMLCLTDIRGDGRVDRHISYDSLTDQINGGVPVERFFAIREGLKQGLGPVDDRADF